MAKFIKIKKENFASGANITSPSNMLTDDTTMADGGAPSAGTGGAGGKGGLIIYEA